MPCLLFLIFFAFFKLFPRPSLLSFLFFFYRSFACACMRGPVLEPPLFMVSK